MMNKAPTSITYVSALILSVVICSLSSCSNNATVLFEIPVEARFQIPPALDNIQTHVFTIRRVPTFYENLVIGDVNGIDRINAGRGILSARFDNVDWGIVQEVAINISPPSDIENQKEVFYQEIIDFSGVEEIRLFSSLSEVKDILLQNFVDIEVRLNFRRTTFQEIDAQLNLNFVAYGPE